MSLKVKPFGKNILIEPNIKENVLLSDKQTICEIGKVVAVGDKVTSFKEGELVGYVDWGRKTIQDGDKFLHFIPEDDDFILGTIDETLE